MKRAKLNNDKITALYCRLSKDNGTNNESMSIGTQKTMLKEYAKRNGFLNCQFYIDDGYSGTNYDRPAFQQMYDWDTAYVSKILHDPVYAGNLTVAERPTKTMCSKKRQYIPYAEREIIYGTHEPIIEQNRWDNVQKILQSRPPVIGESSSGYDNIFRGIIKCADCGSAMLAKVEQNCQQG